jgi:hypothetical protein
MDLNDMRTSLAISLVVLPSLADFSIYVLLLIYPIVIYNIVLICNQVDFSDLAMNE